MAHTLKNTSKNIPTYNLRDYNAETLTKNISSTLFNYLSLKENALRNPVNGIFAVKNADRKNSGANIRVKYAVNHNVLFEGQKSTPFETKDFRVEPHAFYNTLKLPASRAMLLCKNHTGLIFGNIHTNTFYITCYENKDKLDNPNYIEWLKNPKYFTETEEIITEKRTNPVTKKWEYVNKVRTYYNYSISKLLRDGFITKIDYTKTSFSVINFFRPDDEETSDYEEYKLKDMWENCEFDFIQRDGRAAKTIYAFDGKTWISTTVNALASEIYNNHNLAMSETSAQQKVRRLVRTSEMLNEAAPFVCGKQTIYIGYKKDLPLGNSTTTTVTLTKQDIGAKLQAKFGMNYKRHGEEPSKKWTDTEKELYKIYCETKKAKEQLTEELNDANEVVGTIFDDKDAKDYRENLQKQLETVNEALKDEPKTEDTEDYFEMKKKFNFKPHREYKEQKAVCYF